MEGPEVTGTCYALRGWGSMSSAVSPEPLEKDIVSLVHGDVKKAWETALAHCLARCKLVGGSVHFSPGTFIKMWVACRASGANDTNREGLALEPGLEG